MNKVKQPRKGRFGIGLQKVVRMSTSLGLATGKRVRARDVAQLAGVSRSAVSRAFSPTAYIAPETKAKVMKAATELNYSPDSLASGLAKGRSNIVVVVLNQVDAIRGPSFHSALIRSLQDSGRLPVVLSLSPTDDGASSLKKHLTFPVEGLIVMSDSVSVDAARDAVPYVRPIMLNFERTRADVDSIVANDAAGIAELVKYLWETGHRSIGFMAGRPSSASSKIRRDALALEIARRGMHLAVEASGEFNYEQAFEAAPALVAGEILPDAIFCANDVMAFAVMDYLRLNTQHRVPEDVSIVGFDDIFMARWPIYNLSTIRQDVDSMAAAVTAILERRQDPQSRTLGPRATVTELVLRGTIGRREG